MLELLTADALVVVRNSHPLDSEANCAILDGENSVVGAVRDRVGTGRFAARFFGLVGRDSRYEWDVLDADGNRVLDIVKAKEGLRGPNPEVSLANGTPIGHATENRRRMTRPFAPPVRFSAPDGRGLGELVSVFGQQRTNPTPMYRIQDPDGTDVGDIAIRINDDWGFSLSFHPAAAIPVRALSIAYVVCRAQQHATGSTI